MATKRLCDVDGCGKPYHAHGYCSAHATKFKRYGDPLAGRRGAPPGAPLRWICEHKSYADDDCIVWPFEIGRYGYGTVKYKGRRCVASRVMCIIAHGLPSSANHQAMHTCGNGANACMNPRHLAWGTQHVNIAEAVSRGINVRGEKVHWAKLTEADVRRIRELGPTMRQKDIAAMFGVLAPAIGRILSRKRWGWLK